MSLQAIAELSPTQILQKPLIVGASVSADYRTQSPGKRLALRFTTAPNIRTFAKSGRPGVETLKGLREKDLEGRTSILALDLFFWDSALPDAAASAEALKKLAKMAAAHDLPLVLGEIPELLPGLQPSRSFLNKEIRDLCATQRQCFVMPFEKLHRDLMKNGFVTVNGAKLTIREIVPDGLHLSTKAADFLADQLLVVLNKEGA